MNNNSNVIINLNNLKYNVQVLKNEYSNYKYIFANVKNDFFGMGNKCLPTLINNGINYLYTSTLEDALKIRDVNHDIPLLICFEITSEEVYDAINKNITITITNIYNLKNIINLDIHDKIKIHLLIDNGSNKRGISNKEELEEIINLINLYDNIILEGIYTEIETYGILDEYYYQSMNNFRKIISTINTSNLIIHINEPIMYHKKPNFVNGIRFDLSLLGIEENIDDSVVSDVKMKNIIKKFNDLDFPNIDLKLIFQIKTKVLSITSSKKGGLIGKSHIVLYDSYVGIIPIGHKDGLTKAIQKVIINNHYYKILADQIDYMIIEVDKRVSLNDDVYLINQNSDIYSILDLLKTNRYYLMSILRNNLKRIYEASDDEGSLL